MSSSESDYDSEKEAATEKQMILDYLDKNPAPTYAEVHDEAVAAATNPRTAEYIPGIAMEIQMWLAEYGDWNHETCCEIRKNLHDYAKCKELGKMIHDRGGFTALQANFYILKNFVCKGPLRQHVTPYMFHGVGEWEA